MNKGRTTKALFAAKSRSRMTIFLARTSVASAGPATNAQFGETSVAMDVAVDRGWTVFVADPGNKPIRRISNGIIATVAPDGNGRIRR